MTTTTKKTATETYRGFQIDMERMIDILQLELEQHAERGDIAGTQTWSQTSELEGIRKDMVELLAKISNRDASDIEDFLAESNA